HTQLCRTFRRQTSTPRNYRHAESTCPRNHLLTNRANTNEPESTAEKPAGFGKLLLVPFTAAECDHVVGNTPVEREYESKCQLSYGDGILAGAIGNIDAPP